MLLLCYYHSVDNFYYHSVDNFHYQGLDNFQCLSFDILIIIKSRDVFEYITKYSRLLNPIFIDTKMYMIFSRAQIYQSRNFDVSLNREQKFQSEIENSRQDG